MKKSPLITTAIRFGAIAAALAIVLFIVTYYLGKHPLLVAPFLDFRIILFGLFIFFALKEFRDHHQQGVLYFWQGMIGSFVVITIAATFISLGILIFAYAKPEFVSDYVTEMTNYLKGFPPEDIERIGKETYQRNLDQLPATNAKQLAGLYFGQSYIIGFFVSIILSVILRKQPKSE